jgi:hypothetical protein
MTDVTVDGGEMAALADKLATAARSASDARDELVDAWGFEAGVPDPLRESFVEFCRTWVTGLDSIAHHTQFAADYTQAIADAFNATDHDLSLGYQPLHDQSELPPPRPVSPNDPNLA